MCAGGCGGGNSFTPRTPTSKPYTPVKRSSTVGTGHTVNTGGSQSGQKQFNPFGAPKIRFSGRK